MSAVARLAESTIVPSTTITFDPSKWFYGGVALLVFVVLIVAVSRFNMDR
jgi:hypothetical protein